MRAIAPSRRSLFLNILFCDFLVIVISTEFNNLVPQLQKLV